MLKDEHSVTTSMYKYNTVPLITSHWARYYVLLKLISIVLFIFDIFVILFTYIAGNIMLNSTS